MANKTIYVSDNDIGVYEKAKEIAGEGLSSVIARALREFVSRNEKATEGMKEISIKIGSHDSEREQRFSGILLGKWTGFSDDKEWWLDAKIYRTQKNNWVIHLIHVCKASLLINKKRWKEEGHYLTNSRYSELFIGKSIEELENNLPKLLVDRIRELSKKYEVPIEYLDI